MSKLDSESEVEELKNSILKLQLEIYELAEKLEYIQSLQALI